MEGLRTLRGLVSRQKKRFNDGDFDLDLAYITPRIIAMGYPSSGIEAAYRNPASEVQRFLEVRHRGHYKVYNLCSEREEDLSALFPCFEHLHFSDHNPCPLAMLAPLCESIDSYLNEDPANVVAVHCKAGKGRTGLVISAYLLHAGVCASAGEALRRFAEGRTHNGKGVTIPSQIRYVHYFESLLRKNMPRRGQIVQIQRVRLVTIPSFSLACGGCDPYFKVRVWSGAGAERKPVTIYSFKKRSPGLRHYKPDDVFVDLDCSDHGVLVRGDVQVILCAAGCGGMNTDMCSVWFNTRFCEGDDVLEFTKPFIDGARKDKQCKHFSEKFAVQVSLRRAGGADADVPSPANHEITGSDIGCADDPGARVLTDWSLSTGEDSESEQEQELE
jgi:phosphatidylinositol-3,4,5-trisphosphate 3-phosphatase/dual-specificity protein phosphatase PTEN